MTSPASLIFLFLYSPEVATAKKSVLKISVIDWFCVINGFWIPMIQGAPCFDPLTIISPPISIKKLFLLESMRSFAIESTA